MARTKGGPKAMKRRRNILKAAKGYRFSRSKKKRAALEALKHAGYYAFRDRRAKQFRKQIILFNYTQSQTIKNKISTRDLKRNMHEQLKQIRTIVFWP